MTEPLTHEDCLEYGRDQCSGRVEYRMPLSGTGKSFPRCTRHWHERIEEQERIQRDYPDSPSPPAWYDEAAAGEQWNEE